MNLFIKLWYKFLNFVQKITNIIPIHGLYCIKYNFNLPLRIKAYNYISK